MSRKDGGLVVCPSQGNEISAGSYSSSVKMFCQRSRPTVCCKKSSENSFDVLVRSKKQVLLSDLRLCKHEKLYEKSQVSFYNSVPVYSIQILEETLSQEGIYRV